MDELMLVLAIISTGIFLVVLVTTFYYVFAIRPQLLRSVPSPLDDLQKNLGLQHTLLRQLQQTFETHAQQVMTAQHRLHEEIKTEIANLPKPPDIDFTPLEQAVYGLSQAITHQQSALQTHLQQELKAQNQHLTTMQRDLIEGAKRDIILQIPIIPPPPEIDFSEIKTAQDQWGENLRQEIQRNAPLIPDTSLIEGALDHLSRAISEHWIALKQMQSSIENEQSFADNQLKRMKSHLTTHDIALQRLENAMQKQSEVNQHYQLLQDLQGQIAHLTQKIETLQTVAATPPSTPKIQDRLTDIKGIGPVYSSKLYEVGIHTFKQLGRMTPQEIMTVLDLPQGRIHQVKAWIEQAKTFAAQRDKLQTQLDSSNS